MHTDSFGPERGRQRFSDLRLLEREHPVLRLDDLDPGPEPRHDLSKLGTDRTGAQDDDRLREFLCFQHIVVGPVRHIGQTRDGRNCRRGSCGNHHAASSLEDSVSDHDSAGSVETSAPSHEDAALADESIDRDLVVPVIGRLFTNSRRDRGPVRLDGGRASQSVDAASLRECVGRTDGHLRGDAAPIRALATHKACFDTNHGQTSFRQRPGHGLPRHAHSDHYDVYLLSHHCSPVSGTTAVTRRNTAASRR